MGEETGDDEFRIVDFSVDTKIGTTSNFNRVSESHEQALEKFFERTGQDFNRYNYLGEWHTHPSFEVTASIQDIAAMHDLVNESQGIDFSVLLIARLKWMYELEMNSLLFVKNDTAHYLVDISPE